MEAIRRELMGLAERVKGLEAENESLREAVKTLKKSLEEEEEDRREATDNLDEEAEYLHREVERLSSEATTLKTVSFPRPPFYFTLENFAYRKKHGLRWCSQPFYSRVAGYKMCVGVDANGNSVGNGTHVSLTVYLLPGQFDDQLKWPFRGYVTVQLLNERRDSGHHEAVIEFDDDTPLVNSGRVEGEARSTGWGSPLFVPHSGLAYDPATDTEYLKYDRLRFVVTTVSTPS